MACPSLECAENGGTIVADVPSKPVMDVPGETPTSPVMVLPVPAAVAVEPPTIAKVCAEPSDWAIPADGTTRRSAANPTFAKSLEYTRFMPVPAWNVRAGG
jgi:hypothetical protein